MIEIDCAVKKISKEGNLLTSQLDQIHNGNHENLVSRSSVPKLLLSFLCIFRPCDLSPVSRSVLLLWPLRERFLMERCFKMPLTPKPKVKDASR